MRFRSMGHLRPNRACSVAWAMDLEQLEAQRQTPQLRLALDVARTGQACRPGLTIPPITPP